MMNGTIFKAKIRIQIPSIISLTIAPELEIVWILAGATVGIRLEAEWFLAASTKTIE